MKVARDIGIKLYIMEKSTGMSEIRELPVISLKSDIIFPGILIHFDLTKKEDIKAVEEALRSNGQIFLTARRAPESTEVTMDELFDVGTISNVKQFIRLPGNMGRVLVMGQERGRMLELETEGNYPIALVEDYGDADEEYPEAMQRAVVTYKAKGYSDKWISQRLRSIEIRKELTDEWQNAGISTPKEYAALTNILTMAWSGKTVREYKELKGLKKENLRDNMTKQRKLLHRVERLQVMPGRN